MTTALITVSQLNKYVHALLDGDNNLKSVFVSGEISNLKVNSFSGHMYLTLKDDNASVKAVMFKSSASRLKFIPKEGMKVICRGSVTVYEKDGQYQLYIGDMQPDGAGSIAVAFEQLKSRLAAEGLFDNRRKKTLPKFPNKIAVVTSETGAAVHDMINVMGRRWPVAVIVLCPVRVQGDGAAEQIADAIRAVNEFTDCDIMIVGRGGGSAEDLWCFNDEQLARTASMSRIPIISAVGHETDYTILDFVADMRAPTPSAAAEIAVPDISNISFTLLSYLRRINTKTESYFKQCSDRLESICSRRVFEDKSGFIDLKSVQLDGLISRLENTFSQTYVNTNAGLAELTAKLDALNPAKVLLRGFSIAAKDGKNVKSVSQLSIDDIINLRLSDGNAYCRVTDIERNQ